MNVFAQRVWRVSGLRCSSDVKEYIIVMYFLIGSENIQMCSQFVIIALLDTYGIHSPSLYIILQVRFSRTGKCNSRVISINYIMQPQAMVMSLCNLERSVMGVLTVSDKLLVT